MFKGEVNIVQLSPRRCREDYSTIFTEPEENNCFSIITQVIIRRLYFLSSSERNRAAAILKKIVLQYCHYLAWGDYSKI